MTDRTIPEIEANTPSPRIAGVVKTSLADQVEAVLRSAIVRGELRPGERLVELEIARQMHTSQAPVREALQRLEQDGLVERRSRTATYVTNVSWQEVYEAFHVRTVVERMAIRRTARCITAPQCDELQALVEKMAEAGRRGDMAGLSDNDLEFHRLICEWSGNRTLVRVWTPLYSLVQRMLIATHPRVFTSLTQVADAHQPIIDALRAKDPDEAALAMEEHINLIWTRFNDQLPADILEPFPAAA